MEESELNENDRRLLALCNSRPLSINYIAQKLGLTPASISVRVKNLKEAGFVTVNSQGKGKKTFVRTKKEIKTKQFMVEVLSKLESSGGEMGFEEFSKLAPFDPLQDDSYDRNVAFNSIMYLNPPLIRKKVYLTSEGKQFLKENKK